VRKPRRLSAEELAPYQLELPDAAANHHHRLFSAEAQPPIDWRGIFGNDHPVEVEVGFGKGLYLLTRAMRDPLRNFFGIEIVRKYQLYATTRIAVRQLKNVKTCWADAKQVFARRILPASVAAVHIYFPDPWWKKRHKKRLLFTPEFAQSVFTALTAGGRLHFATDVADYFAWVSQTLAAISGFEALPPPPEHVPQHDMDYLTNFERKFRREGRIIYRAEYRKQSEAPM
jgi:tRNA (guanine-N7-)-methyltransferase